MMIALFVEHNIRIMKLQSHYLNYPAGIHKVTREKSKKTSFLYLICSKLPKLTPSVEAPGGDWNWSI